MLFCSIEKFLSLTMLPTEIPLTGKNNGGCCMKLDNIVQQFIEVGDFQYAAWKKSELTLNILLDLK